MSLLRVVAVMSLLHVATVAAAQDSATIDTRSTSSMMRSERINLTTPTGVLSGTLLMPAEVGARVPVVLIHAGSGPTDRDGNSPLLAGANNSLRLLAEGLAADGIASVRFDKRGVAASASAARREEDLRFDSYIEDAAAWVTRLRGDPRFSTVTVIGHSEGSLIGMVAARRAGANGFVSIAGGGRPAQDIIRAQLGQQLSRAITASAERAVATLVAGKMADSIPAELASLFRPSVQPYLISWFRYDPAKEIAGLSVPVLLAQGTNDLQVSVADARLLAAAAPGATLLLIDGMNHVCKAASDDQAAQMRSYGDPTMPIVPALVTAVVELVRSVCQAHHASRTA
jgi:pimeloyl-ACP methyl ester carboxylesterase